MTTYLVWLDVDSMQIWHQDAAYKKNERSVQRNNYVDSFWYIIDQLVDPALTKIAEYKRYHPFELLGV